MKQANISIGMCSSRRDVYYSNLVFQFSAGTDIAGDIVSKKTPTDSSQEMILTVISSKAM